MLITLHKPAHLLVGTLVVFASSAELFAQLPRTGDFDVAYSVVANGHARTAASSSTSIVGPASFGIFLASCLLIAGSTQTFTSTSIPGSGRTTGYGITKFEFNGDVWHKDVAPPAEAPPEAKLNRDFSLDYTITLPTNGPTTSGIEGHAHQFLAGFAFDHSLQHYFEIDVGDYMGGRDAKPGYKHTGLLSLIAQRNLRSDGQSPAHLDFEIDASPSSEGTPASVVAAPGVTYGFQSGLRLGVAALVGVTANDPEIGVSISLKFKGNLAGKGPAKTALTFSRLRRLERLTRFGRFGRF
jgi:hypothetical protein